MRRTFAAASLAAVAACARAQAPPAGAAPGDEPAEVLGAVIRMRTSLFGTAQLAYACDVRRLLGDDPRFRERLRFDARPGVSPGGADDCATLHPGNTWRILAMERVKPGQFRVRVAARNGAEAHREDYMADRTGVYDLRIYSFTYD